MPPIKTINNQIAKDSFLLLIATLFFYCLEFFFRIAPSLVVNRLVVQDHTTTLGIGGLSSAFYFGYAIFQVPAGILLDRYSLRKVLALAMLICVTFFLIFVYQYQLLLGLLSRFMVGVSAAFSFVGALAVTQRYFPTKYFSFISGVIIAFGTLAASIVQTGTAWLMQFMTWHAAFMLFSLVGILLALLIICAAKPPQIVSPRSDHSSKGMNLIFKDMLKLLKNYKIFFNGLIGSLFYMPTSIFVGLWGLSFLKDIYFIPTTEASFYITLLFLGWVVGSPLIGYFGDRLKKSNIVIACFAGVAMLISLFIIYFPLQAGPLLPEWVFLFGLFSSAQVLVWKIYSRIVSKEVGSVGVGVTNMLVMMSGMM